MGEGERWGFIFYLCKSFTFLLHLKTNVLKTTCLHQTIKSQAYLWLTKSSYSDDLTVVYSCCKFMSFESNIAVNCYLDQKPFFFHSPCWIYHRCSALRGKSNHCCHPDPSQASVISHPGHCHTHLFHLPVSFLLSVKYIFSSEARMMLFK